MKNLTSILILILTVNLAWSQTSDVPETLDASFSTVNNKQLTDEQYNAAKMFVHQGIKDEKLKEACKAKGLQDCNPNPADEGVIFKGGIGAVLENNISKLYALFFGGMGLMGGGGSKVTVTKTPKDGGAKTSEKKSDYCVYAAMAGEVIAQGMQTVGQQQAQASTANLNDPQLQALANLKETHKTRKKSATFQSAIYGATTACYAARAAIGGAALDPMYIAKMAAAAGIAVLYKAKADKHAKAMAMVQKVIDSLPKAGDCNPYTGTTCFCAEKTSEKLYPGQYTEMCLPASAESQALTSVAGCAANSNGTISYDAECKCKATKTCFSTSVKSYNPNFSLGKNFASMANTGFDLTQGGTFDEAALNKFSDGASAAYNRIKDKINTSKIPATKLTDGQKKAALGLDGIVPPAVAAMAAASSGEPPAGGLMNGSASAALDKIPDSFKKKLEAEISGNYSSNGGGDSNSGAKEEAFVMPKLGGEESSGSGSEVVSFAQKAIDDAEVSNRPETPIFDIISNRYRSSGWSKVQIAE